MEIFGLGLLFLHASYMAQIKSVALYDMEGKVHSKWSWGLQDRLIV